MKIAEGFKLRTLGRDYIVVGEGLSRINYNKMISLNETAAYLWNSLKDKDFGIDDMVSLLLDKYEVSEETAREDSAKLAQDWIDAGLVTE